MPGWYERSGVRHGAAVHLPFFEHQRPFLKDGRRDGLVAIHGLLAARVDRVEDHPISVQAFRLRLPADPLALGNLAQRRHTLDFSSATISTTTRASWRTRQSRPRCLSGPPPSFRSPLRAVAPSRRAPHGRVERRGALRRHPDAARAAHRSVGVTVRGPPCLTDGCASSSMIVSGHRSLPRTYGCKHLRPKCRLENAAQTSRRSLGARRRSGEPGTETVAVMSSMAVGWIPM